MKYSVVEMRWGQLAVGIVGMVTIANLQYGWALSVNPIDSKFHWGKAAIQVAFTPMRPKAPPSARSRMPLLQPASWLLSGRLESS